MLASHALVLLGIPLSNVIKKIRIFRSERYKMFRGYFAGATDLKLTGLLAMMVAAYALTLYLSYMLERLRRMMFLTNQSLQDVFNRQESWAYTLIDLDMSLSGILQFKELISRLMEHMKTVIHYDSFVLTALDHSLDFWDSKLSRAPR